MNIICIGVCGCGKSTIGKILAEKLACDFIDADDYHTHEAKKKMGDGIPLTDQDRSTWLICLREKLDAYASCTKDVVLACSALKQTYRDLLAAADKTIFIYLKGEKKLIEERMGKRKNHYMPIDLIESQFEILEEPNESASNVLVMDITRSIDNIVTMILNSDILLETGEKNKMSLTN